MAQADAVSLMAFLRVVRRSNVDLPLLLQLLDARWGAHLEMMAACLFDVVRIL